MPPRLPPRLCVQRRTCELPLQRCRYATTTTAFTPAPSLEQLTTSITSMTRYPPSQPPSYRPPEFRKSQLHRQYTSLLRSTPLMLLFQHNNLKSTEWMGIRREIVTALRKVDRGRVVEGGGDAEVAESIKVQIIQTGIFAAALRVVEYFRPDMQSAAQTSHLSDPATPTSTPIPKVLPTADDPRLSHGLSRAAHDAVMDKKFTHALSPLLSGPLVAVTFPTVSPQHLKAVLSILSPSRPNFPAPSRRVNPGYYDLTVQSGLQKLLLLGARVEGKVFDVEGTKWVGGIEGGLDGLRGQLVAMLSGIGAGITNTLESAGRSLYFTVEGRKGMLEDEQKGPEDISKDNISKTTPKAP